MAGNLNGGRMLVAAALLYVMVAAPCARAAITCGQVASSISPCLSYIQDKGPLVPGCCSGASSLNSLARTTPDRQQACTCLKNLSGNIPGINLNKAAGLPGQCGVNIPYRISRTIDCSTVR